MSFSPSRVDRAARASAAKTSKAARIARPRFPDIVEFVTSPEYLNRPKIYPRQLALLKLLFLALDLLTPFDLQVIAGWRAGFVLPDEPDGPLVYQGNHGLPPDVLDRAHRLKAEGRLWFRDVVAVIGRRGSKGYLAAIAFSYILFWYVTQDDPHRPVNVAPGKLLSVVIFAGNKAQAVDNLWRDVVDCIEEAPCFAPYRTDATSDTLRLYSHAQIASAQRPPKRRAAFTIVAAETTPRAVRGRAAIGLALDEAAHMVASGANRSAGEIWNAAKPALGQCGPQGMFGFAWQGSSPWAMVDQFYESYQHGLTIDPRTGNAVAYDTLVVQLPSWDLYEDYELTQRGDFEMTPGGAPFLPIDEPQIAYDERLQREETLNPEDFNVEYRAHFATSPDRYLPVDAVDALFGPWNGALLVQRTRGVLAEHYEAHADPASVNDKFGFAIAHAEPNDTEIPDIVFDVLHFWDPARFPDHTIDYLEVEAELAGYLDRFNTTRCLTFDQHNSQGMVQRLRRHANQPNRPVRTTVETITNAHTTKFEKYENFKKLLLMGRVHAPLHELARLELLFLRRVGDRVNHQTYGTITSNDIADCIVEVVARLVDPSVFTHEQISNAPLGATAQGGLPLSGYPFGRSAEADDIAARFSASMGYGRSMHGEIRGIPPRGGGRPRWPT
jgi:hypothetical protein